MRHSVRNKLVGLAIIVILIPTLLIGIVNYIVAKNELDSVGRLGLQNGALGITQLISTLDNQVKLGNLTLEEAQEMARSQIIGTKNADGTRTITNDITYGDNFYFYAVTEDGIAVAHPTIEGDNTLDLQTAEGRYFMKEIIDKANHGGGFVGYDWPLPNEPNTIAPKIAYATKDSNWGWVIVASTYEMDFNAGAKNVLLYAFIVTVLAVSIGIVLFWFFSGRMTSYIRRIMVMTSDIAKGKLTGEDIPLLTKDELGTLATNVNNMKQSLNEMVGNTRDSSLQMRESSETLSAITEQTTASADEIHLAISAISSGAVTQAEEAEEAITKVEALSTLIATTTHAYGEITTSMNTIISSQTTGQQRVEQLKEGSLQFTAVIDELRTNFSGLTTQMQEIQNIVQTITSISEQTNLLALNASIEAARAGEHGKGFAVVAEEVRKLAEQTNSATSHVRGVLHRIEADATNADTKMQHTLALSSSQVLAIDEVHNAFNQLSAAITSISEHLTALDNSMVAMSDNRLIVVKAINEIATVATASAAATEEINASIDEQKIAVTSIMHSSVQLHTEAERMHELVERFT
ncbi:Methyl-accepting chemotaxis protein 4 [Metalysinibacillus saudimassiliensis]|uniref:Methyl-accepting chemotaxis protein 4 n=1 Tax=Metalysinibacillus saudimassiliensis TaxID=1461583 RepID=A0A078M4A1_9BACL|nr:Methyl-accepting chemotaxis protein 4 [Metalysinibacillus saudimassiliensis]